MSTGETLFAQLMDFLSWSTFDRIIARDHGDRAVRTEEDEKAGSLSPALMT
jgi:hypothetical protein